VTTPDDRIHVLHVDDEQAFDSMAAGFPSHGDDRITFRTATTPNEGLELLNNHDIDCIVSEYDIPGRDGLSFLKTVREEYPNLPFIFYTNKDFETVVSETISTGNTDYVPKGSSTEHFAFLAQRIITATEQQRASESKRIAALVRDIQSDLVRARTREEFEPTVCERLVDADPYTFAWIGSLDADTPHVTPRALAGQEAGYLDTIEITADDSAAGQGPTGRAIKTRSTQVIQDISADPTYDPWREAALERSYQSSAAIPIEYDETLYGVLNVYAAHPKAFDADEQSLLEDLSETIAHAYYRIQARDQYDSQYQELFEDAPVMMAFTREANGEPIIEDCNSRFADKLGYSRAELQEQPLVSVYTETSTERLLDKRGYQRSLEGDFTPQEREFVTADDERLVTLLQATPRRNKEGDIIGTHTLYVDITDRKRAQSVLEQAEAMEASMDGIGILNEDGEFVYINQAHADIYGYNDPEALLGNTWRMLYEDDEIDRFENEVLPLTQDQGRWRGEATGRRKNDKTFDQDLSLTETDNGSLVCVVRDITDRKEYEQKLEDQRDDLEVLNQVVRHDIRNDMAVVSGRANLLEEHVEEGGKKDLEAIQDSVESATGLTKTARDLSDIMLSTEEDVEPTRLDQCLNSVIRNVREKFDTAVITTEDQIPGTQVRGNELLETVFRNLIYNAVVHNDKQKPEVRVSMGIDEETTTVRIADNGPGIPDTQKETIFGKGEKGLDSPGTGLGLYLVQTLVKQYGGDVWVEDNDPEGSVFIVELPKADAE